MIINKKLCSILLLGGTLGFSLAVTGQASAQEFTMKTKIVKMTPKTIEESFMQHGVVKGVRNVVDHPNAGPDDPPQTVSEEQGEFPDGEYWEYHPSGQFVQYFRPYKDGLKEGLYREMTLDNLPKLSVSYKKGRKNGPLTIFHPNGEPKLIIPYVDNVREGILQNYLANGKLDAEENFRRGEAQAFEKTKYDYDPDGKKRSEHFFNFETGEGHRKYFNKDGTVDWEVGIKGDQLVGYKKYGIAGNVIDEQAGPFNGDVPSYYASGELMQNDHYRNGFPAGFTMFDLRGRVLMKSL